MSWCIAADSSCNLRSFEPAASDTSYRLAPLKINVGGTEYVDDRQLDVDAFLDAMADEKTASSSSCPSVGEWAEIFCAHDNVIAIAISEDLSGSYEAACTARNIVMDDYMREHDGVIAEKNIYVLNSRAAGGKLEVIVRLLDRYLTTNPSFDEAVAMVEQLEASSQVLYSLSRYENLAKNGRMPRLVGAVATKLSIRILGTASAKGAIKIVGPTRGEKKMYRKIMDTMEGDGYRGGLVYIDHVRNLAGAEALKRAIIERWPAAEVEVIACGGLCSYYAEESGLIIGYAW
ncbi:MAG: DegV family EDD domain-containing protein [Coriobacteriaceae bacterium]|nr:DegV family EDD domain-containing protein [Coriobacteriaceae bacterium]